MEKSKYVLEMVNICKSFPGVKALDNAQLKVRPGTVHALMGENGAGKSTLMKCLFGVYIEDEGKILIDGEECKFSNPKQAMENGVSMVHQELNQVLQRDVMDNIWLGRYPSKNGIVSQKIMYEETKKIFDDLEIDVDPREKMAKLSVSQRQMVEIAKAASYNAKILVLDEPTSSLTQEEVDHLFKIMNKLKEKGCGLIYISHKMEEILQISDDVTIMRDGKWIDTLLAKELTTDKIIKLMVGRDLTHRFPPKTNKPGETILEVKNLVRSYNTATFRDSKNNVNILKGISFQVVEGEFVGIMGKSGCGKTTLLKTLGMIDKPTDGTIKFMGEDTSELYGDKLADIRNSKIGFIFQDFYLMDSLSVEENIMLPMIISKQNINKMIAEAKKYAEQFQIEHLLKKNPYELSGGEKQRVAICRALINNPDLILADEPTGNLDSKSGKIVIDALNKISSEYKKTIVMVTHDPQMASYCSRLILLKDGVILEDLKNSGNQDAFYQEILGKMKEL